MVWSDGRWVCVREDSTPLPTVDAVNDPLSHPALAETVRRLLADAKPRQVFVSISSSEVLLRRIQLPEAVPQAGAEQQNLAIEAALESEDYIPVSLDSVAYDFHLMTESTLLVGWMRKVKLASISEQHPELVYLTPQPVTLANHLLSEGSERICGVHLDGEFCDLVVVEAGELCFGRSFFVGSPDQLGEAVQQSLANCPNPTGAALERIVLLGNASESMCDRLAGQLGVEVTISGFEWHTALLKPIQSPVSSDRWSVKSKNKTSHWRPATGTASGHWIRLNLLAPALVERAAQRKSRRKRLLMRMVPVTAIILLLGAHVTLYHAIKSKSERINALRLNQAQVKTLQTETKSLQKRYTALEGALAQLAWGDRRFPTLAERLVHIANQCPAAVRLTEIKTVPPPRGAKAAFDARRVLLVVGVAPAQTEIDAFRAALLIRSEFSSARQIKTEQVTVAGERRLEFTLALESSGETVISDE